MRTMRSFELVDHVQSFLGRIATAVSKKSRSRHSNLPTVAVTSVSLAHTMLLVVAFSREVRTQL